MFNNINKSYPAGIVVCWNISFVILTKFPVYRLIFLMNSVCMSQFSGINMELYCTSVVVSVPFIGMWIALFTIEYDWFSSIPIQLGFFQQSWYIHSSLVLNPSGLYGVVFLNLGMLWKLVVVRELSKLILLTCKTESSGNKTLLGAGVKTDKL